MLHRLLVLVLLVCTIHQTVGADCRVGKNGGFLPFTDDHGDADEMKKLASALHMSYSTLLSEQAHAGQ